MTFVILRGGADLLKYMIADVDIVIIFKIFYHCFDRIFIIVKKRQRMLPCSGSKVINKFSHCWSFRFVKLFDAHNELGIPFSFMRQV